MDRNALALNLAHTGRVALRKESVDRHMMVVRVSMAVTVALRKESVDRNRDALRKAARCIPSLSARRAWIEIGFHPGTAGRTGSLSARRAWIEIGMQWLIIALSLVALRKESVDRNIRPPPIPVLLGGRSPQGERG